MRTVGMAAALALLGGCDLLAPPALELQVTPGECGAWRADVDAAAFRGTLTVLADGDVMGEWAVSGERRVEVEGTGVAGQEVLVEAELSGARASRRVALPAPTFTVDLAPRAPLHAGQPGVAALEVTGCPAPDAWRVKVEGPGGAVAEGPLAAPPTVAIPSLPEGPTQWRITVTDGGREVTSTEVALIVAGPCDDMDGDGVSVCDTPADCDDTRASVSPRAPELTSPNGVDDDCDGAVDEGTIAYDDDGDGTSEQQGDCDDADPARHPGAPELPDCRDQDCDGQVDEGVTRPPSDDAFEDNDAQAHAHDLETWSDRKFRTSLAVVSRSEADEEWFQFYSQDGDFDDWRIFVTGDVLPTSGAYDVTVFDASGSTRGSARVAADGDRVMVTGAAFRDDSGLYRVRIRPLALPGAFCPATFTIVSR